MGNKTDIKTLINEASSLVELNAEEVDEDSAVLVLKNPEDLDLAKFRALLEAGSLSGFDVFTGPEGSSRIYLSRKFEKTKTWSFSFKIKAGLALAAIISTYYVGYEYQLAYSSSSGLGYLLSYVTVFFVAPIALIIIAREAGRYLALKTDGIKYSFPVIMPDPIGVGIIGSVISQRQPFVTKKCMLKSGVYPLVFGYAVSTFFLLIGLFVLPGMSSYAPTVDTPITKLSLPLLFSLTLFKLAPQSVALNLFSYAGWVGIVMNSFNALPLGYLDGGLVFSSISPSYSKLLSYISIAALLGLSIVYASWFILIIFALVIGLQGPNALFSIHGLSRRNKAIILLVLFFVIGGIVPVPFHISPPNFAMSSYQDSYMIVNGTHTNISIRVEISDFSGSVLVPAFAVSPSSAFTISANSSLVDPGGTGVFTLLLDTGSIDTTGMYHYNITAYSGTSSQKSEITVLSVNESNQISFSDSNPLMMDGQHGDPVNISLIYNSIGERNITIYSLAPDNFSYIVKLENITLQYIGSTELLSSSFVVRSGIPLSLSFTANTPVKNWEIVAMTDNYNAAVALITIT